MSVRSGCICCFVVCYRLGKVTGLTGRRGSATYAGRLWTPLGGLLLWVPPVRHSSGQDHHLGMFSALHAWYLCVCSADLYPTRGWAEPFPSGGRGCTGVPQNCCAEGCYNRVETGEAASALCIMDFLCKLGKVLPVHMERLWTDRMRSLFILVVVSLLGACLSL